MWTHVFTWCCLHGGRAVFALKQLMEIPKNSVVKLWGNCHKVFSFQIGINWSFSTHWLVSNIFVGLRADGAEGDHWSSEGQEWRSPGCHTGSLKQPWQHERSGDLPADLSVFLLSLCTFFNDKCSCRPDLRIRRQNSCESISSLNSLTSMSSMGSLKDQDAKKKKKKSWVRTHPSCVAVFYSHNQCFNWADTHQYILPPLVDFTPWHTETVLQHTGTCHKLPVPFPVLSECLLVIH